MSRQVEFVGEEAVDAGGVTKEFFKLLSVEMFQEHFGMFTQTDARTIWFRTDFEMIEPESFRTVGER